MHWSLEKGQSMNKEMIARYKIGAIIKLWWLRWDTVVGGGRGFVVEGGNGKNAIKQNFLKSQKNVAHIGFCDCKDRR